MSDKLPLFLDLRNRSIYCIGGGQVAVRRVLPLLEHGAKVTIVSPALHEDLYKQQERFQWEKRKASEGETYQSQFLLICTNDHHINESLHKAASNEQWVYAAYDSQKSDLHFPAIIQEPNVTVGITTNGIYPSYLKKIKRILGEALNRANITSELSILAPVRERILQLNLSQSQKKKLLHKCQTEEFLTHTNRDQLLDRWIKETGSDCNQ